MTQRRARPEPILKARLGDARILASLLRPIAFTKICQVVISGAGLQVVTELNGVIQATAYVGSALFDEFKFNLTDGNSTSGNVERSFDSDDEDAPVAILDVSLERWLMCLSIYGLSTNVFSSSSKGAFRSEGQAFNNADAGNEFLRRAPFSRSKTDVEMVYVGRGHPLSLIVRQGQVVSKCELATFETETLVISDMPYVAERTIGQVIMPSKDLTEALMSIDSSSREVTVAFIDHSARQDLTLSATQAPQTPSRRVRHPINTLAMRDDQQDGRQANDGNVEEQMMRISAVGDTGSTELDFPNKNKVFESFSIKFASKHAYAFANVQHCFRALQTSIKTSIRIDDQGMMSMQCLFPERPTYEQDASLNDGQEMAETENRGFIEIRILPAVTDDEFV